MLSRQGCVSCVRREPAVGPGSRVDAGGRDGPGSASEDPQSRTAPAVAPRPFTYPCKRGNRPRQAEG